MVIFKSGFIFFSILVASGALIFSEPAGAKEENGSEINISTDLYMVQTNLMPYKGYQNDISATVYAQYADYQLLPFVRYVLTNYYYLNEYAAGPGPGLSLRTDYTSDRRDAAGGGLDYKFNNYLKFRFVVESINNKLSDTSYTQESYGLIYNQYLEYEYIEFSNYLEAFLIPRVSSDKIDTYFKMQALKSFYINRSVTSSNAVYPFVQAKLKINDDANFGVSGQTGSVGAGYRFYGVNATKDSFTFILESHSVFYQSENFNGDWSQFLAALQLWID